MTDNNLTTTRNENSVQSSKGRSLRAVQPAVDISEDANGITVLVDLPGVSKDKLDLQVHDANLYIEAESNIESDESLSLHHAELRSPRFVRAFTLSTDFDTEKIDANLKDGVLKVTIPRHEKARPRRIEVQAS